MYFKNLLEVTDLEELREAVAAAGRQFAAVSSPVLGKLQTCSLSLVGGNQLQTLLNVIPDSETVALAFSETAASLLRGAQLPVPAKDAERYASLRKALDSARSKRFPISGLAYDALSGWAAPDTSAWEGIEGFSARIEETSEETKRLTKLFSEVLALKEIADADKPLDCPVCASHETLTPERVLAIRERLKADKSYNDARLCAEAVVRDLQSAARSLECIADKALPESIRLKGKWRRESGFRVAKIRELLGTCTPALANEWLQRIRELSRVVRLTSKCARAAVAGVGRFSANLTQQTSTSELKSLFARCGEAYQLLQTASSGYFKTASQLRGQLQAIIDETIAVAGWNDFLELSARQSELLDALVQKSATDTVIEQHGRALKEIDRAIENVLETKFATLSAEVANWWERLRPGETTFFESVKQRPKTRRTVDFKAGLCVGDDRKDASLRDAVAVFSQSQLHCLGLASFLARAIREPNGFMVFDDPTISSDEDYRAHFVCTVLEELVSLGQQVLLLTQDQRTWQDVSNRYAHKDVDVFQITRDKGATVITKTSDGLAAMLLKAEPYVRGEHPEMRKRAAEILRDATERFCKELLVRERTRAGDSLAKITDYDRKTLGDLRPLVCGYLNDPSHPGKLLSIERALNPGKHDDQIPSRGDLVVSLGDLKHFKKTYLA